MSRTLGDWFYDRRTECIGFSGGWLASLRDREGEGLGDQTDDGLAMAAAPKLLDTCRALSAAFKLHYRREYVEPWLCACMDDIDAAIAAAEEAGE